jgi:hypothetical protein
MPSQGTGNFLQRKGKGAAGPAIATQISRPPPARRRRRRDGGSARPKSPANKTLPL